MIIMNGTIAKEGSNLISDYIIEFEFGREIAQVSRYRARCLACEALLGSLQAISEDPMVRSALNEDMANFCNQLPLKMHAPCLDVVMQLAPQLEVVLQEIPLGPMVCYRAKDICRPYENSIYSDVKDCEKGPDFWCRTTANAALCGPSAIKHCQEEYWKADKPIYMKFKNLV